MAESKNFILAIDGTAGAGKTTIGQMLAAKFKVAYLDTGAMYRAVTLVALQQGIQMDDAPELAKIARNLKFKSRDATPEEAEDGRQYTVLLNGEDISIPLRSAEVEEQVSLVAAVAAVRQELVARQQEIARQAGSIIMIGRDIGSVVLPEANLKIYLDASPGVRAKRRSKQGTQELGKPKSQEEALLGLAQRDRLDSSRQTNPLVIPAGALIINTDHLSQQQVLEKIEVALEKVLH